MHLLTAWYHDPAPERAAELRECLRRNADNPCIAEIHLFVEESGDPGDLARANAKIRLIPHGRRLTYADALRHAGRHLAGRPVVLANADIYFDDSLGALADHDLAGRMLCLSRWDVGGDGVSRLFEEPRSQDAWAFRPPLPPIACEFPLGVPGCDNRFAAEARRGGLLVANPSRTVRAHHLHHSGVRRYSERQRLGGEYLSVPPVELSAIAPRCGDPRQPIYALTSLSPAAASEPSQRAALQSWRRAGLHPVSFNHPAEIPALARRYDIELVAVERTAETVFGRPFVPIHAMAEWALRHAAPVMLINADIELRLTPHEAKRLRWIGDGGLVYLVRWNHDGVPEAAVREAWGIDAFLFHGRDAGVIAESFLSMGQPWWDYWLPTAFARSGRPLFAVEHPVAFHRNHPRGWNDGAWHEGALEFDRLTGELGADRSPDARAAMSIRLRATFDRWRRPVAARATPIRDWATRRFADPRAKTFLELGAHTGTDTAWMAALPRVTIHAFEPDPRNRLAPRPNVIVNRAAVADREGTAPFVLSRSGWGREWTYSSSLRRPKNHLRRYPVDFGETIEVATVTLDGYCRGAGIGPIEFIWADIQGAEGDMLRGGRETLARTRYLYTEYSDDELYEGQITLAEMLDLLPGFRVVELYEDDVLLENERWRG